MTDNPLNIELTKWLYKLIESVLKLWEQYKPKTFQITGVKVKTADGDVRTFFVGEKHHIDNHSGACTKDMHCTVAAIISMKKKRKTLEVLFEGGHKLIYSQIEIRATYLKKV
jgi:hypothetical protein